MLPPELVGGTADVRHAAGLQRDPKRLFNGAPATYADIAAGLTFRRSAHDKALSGLNAVQPILAILGAGGVGKTTLARQLVADRAHNLDGAWEHNNSFHLNVHAWSGYERALREQGKKAILLVDDCTNELAQVSQLVDHLGALESPALELILTATTGKWNVRSKSAYLYSRGRAIQLSPSHFPRSQQSVESGESEG